MKRFYIAVLTGSFVALTGLTSCAAPNSQSQADFATEAETASLPESVEMNAAANSAIAQAPETSAQGAADSSSPTPKNQVSRRPQLIKKANLSLDVESIDESFKKVREIVNAQQGDVLSLDDRGGDEIEGLKQSRRQIRFEMRVPADNLNRALDALTELGEVRDRSITTEDVSAQLVDIQARVSNSRKSEAALQEIMSRSGDISDVLEVSRELSQVRQEIEQMTARQESLKAQVRYSTISLSLESVVASSNVSNKPAFSRQISSSWRSATSSVGEFTTDLLQLGIWLLAYSPYLAILLCGAVMLRKATRSST